MPKAVYVLALGIFAMVTSEFAVAGLMPQIAEGLGATIPEVGYLITAFAAAMVIGGPLLAAAVLKLPYKSALMALFAVFLSGNVLAALATDYATMAVGRVVTGVASAAFFGVALALVAEITTPRVRGKAIGAAMNGLMLGTLLGLPLSTFVGGQFGWRAAFWAISGLTLAAALAVLVGIPSVAAAGAGDGPSVREEMRAFRNPRLWLVFSTSTLIIGATFSAFSYFTPILTGLTGFGEGSVPWLLVAYGAATVVGNTVVGRLADRHTIVTQLIGLGLNALFLAGFAVFAEVPAPALICMMGIGLVGVTMNPCMITRVQRTANARPLVNTVHSSFITLGIVIGSWLGGVGITTHGLRAPLVLGALMAFLGVFTLLPDLRPRRPRNLAAPEPQRVAA
ncbi:MFS transporter [Streptomyces sp. NBC_01565]|uniref:MFS transporter n=1 Tax=unclassified Streptomyces TaxID=2593676 RepID=UPI002251AF76|nr:MFS transporter [Streptomyces sp. NBC_01565]MCX4539531.1 MFS transporter [Streptomyces sp. NBC_01565]